ncbi:MAG: hypothetical protein F7B17_04380 [Desulfurococcales archaeon]|nr:hypothetical protein [Desulfurococcales archaeon]
MIRGRGLEGYFMVAGGLKEALLIRKRDTIDLARRRFFLRPEQVRLTRGPTRRVAAVFNPAVEVVGGELRVYARIEVGYYSYASVIGFLNLDLADVLGRGFDGVVDTEPIIIPGDWVDFWGAEDPRLSYVGGEKLLVYTGRTIFYMTGEKAPGRTYPVIASEGGERGWVKRGYIALARERSQLVVSDKNAFLVEAGGRVLAFHRVHDMTGRFHLLASTVSWPPEGGGLARVEALESWIVMEASPFEDKVGWATPVFGYKGRRGEVLTLLHGVEAETLKYKAFAALVNVEGEPRLVAVTPRYIMEPREPEEQFGDRPQTIYPCGAWLVDDQVLVSYGAGDMAAGFATIDLSALEEELDRGRIE